MKLFLSLFFLGGIIFSLFACEMNWDAPEEETSKSQSCNADDTPAKCSSGYLYRCQEGTWVKIYDCWGMGKQCYVNCVIRGIGSLGGCAQ